MNFDDLKDGWARDKMEKVPVGTATLIPGRTSSAISMIRRNMKREFIALVVTYAALIIIFIWLSHNGVTVLIAGIATFILFMQSAYVFFRFSVFYKSMSRYDLNVRKSLRNIIYELELNIEIYRTYSFCAIPLATLAGFAFLGDKAISSFVRLVATGASSIQLGSVIWVFVTLVIIQAVSAFFLHLHIQLQYGRYLKELRRIVDELETEE